MSHGMSTFRRYPTVAVANKGSRMLLLDAAARLDTGGEGGAVDGGWVGGCGGGGCVDRRAMQGRKGIDRHLNH